MIIVFARTKQGELIMQILSFLSWFSYLTHANPQSSLEADLLWSPTAPDTHVKFVLCFHSYRLVSC